MEKEKMAGPGSRIMAGVSGGADSVCLLAVLTRLGRECGWRIGAVHVDHGLREEAGEDARFVQELCARLQVPFFLKEENVEEKAGQWHMSVEEAGRKVRYQAFEEAAERFGADRIAVAHNRNDRAETLLFHLFRGTGLKGMASIRPVRGKIIRPLLDTGREEIEGWLKQNGITWRTDRSNDTDAYTRNRIRRHVLPYAEREICPEADLHLAQAADLLARTSDFIEGQAKKALEECMASRMPGKLEVDAEAFRAREDLLQTQMLKLMLEELTDGGKDIGLRHIRDVQELFDRQSGRRLTLPGGLEAEKSFETVILQRKEKSARIPSKDQVERRQEDLLKEVRRAGSIRLEIPGGRIMEITLLPWEKSQGIEQKTYTKWLDYDRMKSLVLRTRRPGDYLAINDRLQRKSLKEYLIQEKVPAGERENLPLLADGSHILWVIGYRISSAVKVTDSTERVLRIDIRGGKEDG
ncbi:MAG TPA: tRNA lysidine(34) synthetase TilS [Candidatus Eisenbergiella merdipullorum]|uniref:tRNA(Ile)-lysidine synthase n=1 Tax=Candidatus Eisenbergiella merdipullorum TaxID=2838553 RepID=A0A9D2I5D7_9FIRM|nr:tRNA lysidine(34) synthetase TilS [Candidatus Eisenbergiella merdipullorum]